ncbi:MAG: hypothetical protein AB8B56_10130 [Crocinitomicaceae bacterium]
MKGLILTFTFFTVYFFAQGQNSGNQKAWYQCENPEKVDSTMVNREPGKIYFDFAVNETPKKPKKGQFSWLENYPEDYFVSYLVNTTDSIFRATRQDGSLMMIQEALDEDGNWSPIEFWVHSGCGNSYFNPLELNPNECILVPIKRYTGDFKTYVRLRFKYGNQVLFSNTFEASIDPSQFSKETDDVKGILYYGRANYFETE